MYARQLAARLLALAAIVGSGAARVQPTESIFVDVAPDSAEFEEVERRYTGELMQELNSVSADALLLFTEYTGWAGADLKSFLRNISSLTEETLAAIDPRVLDHAPTSCRKKLDSHLKKIEYDAHRAGSFNGKNHHKFLLGHMIVFKMHLNKSEDYVKKCYKIIEDCGVHCENTPRMIRWRRLALEEISRVRDDIEHSRRSYRDLLLHSRRRLRRIRQQADTRANVAAKEFRNCLQPVERRSILQQCESNINTSLALDKDDRLLIANWTAEFQVRQVNVTAHYRLEMTRHRERSFRMVHLNTKWKECLRLHNREVRMSKITYYEREGECLKTANSDDGGRRKTVDQVEKEIKKWRKSYKYLSNLCDANNPGNKEESEQCLAQYIKNDNYHATFERLIVLKLEAMSELLERFNSCLSGLEECLRRCFSDALQNVRTVMVVLNQCYKSSKDE